ncbi:hypothetical protein SK128_005780 [Halocaridina rubra]|uniref:NACHT domain-containing protein n=1 Tax=Halocaridina rubra TaxID=373956 RepID=A0AAN9A6X4_HALRR
MPESSRNVLSSAKCDAQVTGGYSLEDIHLFRLRKMATSAGQTVMHHVYRQATRDRLPNQSLFEFYEKKGVNVKVFRKNLNPHQTERIISDPDGKSFDITLLYLCIQYGGCGTVDGKDKVWREDNDSLEFLLTTLKNRRNELFHDALAISESQFFNKTEEFRKLLTKILQYTGIRYKLTKMHVQQLIDALNENLNVLRDSSLIPHEFEYYKKQSLFKEKCEYVQIEGRTWLCELYDDWVYITPASLVCDIDFKVKDIYTEMVLRSESKHGKRVQLKFNNVLDDITQSRKDPLILIEGLAGVGKTTLTKKIMDDWVSGSSSMTGLTSYDFLLYTECRDRFLKSFKELVVSLMSHIAVSFQDSDFINVILSHKVLVIVDGLDEFNTMSMCLFKDLLALKKTYGITVIATTRPERVKTYYELSKSNYIKTKHIELLGIPINKREEFVKKYHEEMKKQGKTNESVNELLKFLKRTAYRLSQLWSLPFNLTLVVILWVYKSVIVNQITSAPELYWEIHKLVIGKLSDRLRNNEKTQAVQESIMQSKVHDFVYTLAFEALNGLAQNEINLSDESLKNLEDACNRQELPAEEMTGAFLRRIIMKTRQEMTTRCSFPHKGLQDFLGALYIQMLTQHEIHSQDIDEILTDIERTLCKHNVPNEIHINVMRLVSGELTRHAAPVFRPEILPLQTTKVRGILESLERTSEFDVGKYQNLLTTLLGLFHLTRMGIRDSVKTEVLELLKESGVQSRDDWIRILASIKCDEFIANFISQQHNIFKGYLKINDATILAFVSVLRALNKPIPDVQRVSISINVEDTAPINELLDEINKKHLTVKRLMYQPDFRHPKEAVTSEKSIKELFERSPIKEYWGIFTLSMTLPASVSSLRVSLQSGETYNHLKELLISYTGSFALCLALPMERSFLSPLPGNEHLPDIYLADLDSSNIYDAVQIAKALQPINENYEKLGRIAFPRCSLNDDDIKTLIEEMAKAAVAVALDISFPSSIKFKVPEEEQKLQNEAQTLLGCKNGIRWGGSAIDEW